jgi:signal transduction histidine kinase
VVIKETAEVLEKALGKDISIHYDFKNEINYVEADKNQIQQVLTNIIINAKDAMPSGGKLIFKTENVDIDDENSKIYPDLNKGNYVKVSIIDSGIGITEEIKEKIFEPFFTTKEESKGTGLGLATAYGIIKNHKGHITFNSEQNKGTIFIIYLPVSEISQNK